MKKVASINHNDSKITDKVNLLINESNLTLHSEFNGDIEQIECPDFKNIQEIYDYIIASWSAECWGLEFEDVQNELFGNQEQYINERIHTIEGLTNDLEDITDEQVAEIEAELRSKIPADINIADEYISLDARRVFLKYTTIDSIIEMYKNK